MPESSIDLDVSPAEAWQRLSPTARRHMLVADLRSQGISDCGTLEPVGFGHGRPTALGVFHQDRRMTLERWPDHSFVNGAGVDVPWYASSHEPNRSFEYLIGVAPGFTDEPNDDVRLATGSLAYEAGMQAIPFDRIGLAAAIGPRARA